MRKLTAGPPIVGGLDSATDALNMIDKYEERWVDRRQAIKIIAASECDSIPPEDREAIILNAWGLDERDEIFHLLPSSLREELLSFGEPQADIMSSQYDTLVRVLCESGYSEYPNEELAAIVSDILKRSVTVDGKRPEKQACPCCGEKTLSIRGEYDICSNCGWEDDGIEEEGKYSNPNHMTLKQGKENYLLYGRCGGKPN